MFKLNLPVDLALVGTEGIKLAQSNNQQQQLNRKHCLDVFGINKPAQPTKQPLITAL